MTCIVFTFHQTLLKISGLVIRSHSPGQHDVVGQEGGQGVSDDADRYPEHDEHRTAEDHHGRHETPHVTVDGQVDHLWTDRWIYLKHA